MTPYKKYDQYKDSGVAGLEQIPATWRVLSWKRALKAESGGTVIKNTAFSEPGENRFPAYSASGQDVWLSSYMFDVPGLVISAVGARCGRVFHAKEKWGVVANTACAFPKKNTDLRYMWYVVNQPDWWEIGGSAQPYVKISESLDRIGVLPPLPEQRAIADYLDRETAKIDALIDKKTRLVELLEEKRQATISHAVTKGLDPNAPMKDSGVPWLGEVPAHWEVKKLKYTISKTGSGTTPAKDDDYVESGGIPWVTTSELRETTIVETKKQVSHDAQRTYAPLVIHPKRSLLIAMYGATVGRLGRLGIAATSNQACFAIHPDQTNSIDYLELWFRAYRQEIIFLSIGAGQPNISGGILRNLVVPIPPIDERQTIITIVNKAVQTITKTQNHVSQSITLLREKRSALITAAVTGQIDVRGEVA